MKVFCNIFFGLALMFSISSCANMKKQEPVGSEKYNLAYEYMTPAFEKAAAENVFVKSAIEKLDTERQFLISKMKAGAPNFSDEDANKFFDCYEDAYTKILNDYYKDGLEADLNQYYTQTLASRLTKEEIEMGLEMNSTEIGMKIFLGEKLNPEEIEEFIDANGIEYIELNKKIQEAMPKNGEIKDSELRNMINNTTENLAPQNNKEILKCALKVKYNK